MRQITARTISEITIKPVDTTAITEINEELSKGLQYWRISSITLSKNDKGLPNRLTKDEAEAIIEFAKSSPTIEELEANQERLKAKYAEIFGETVEEYGADPLHRTTEVTAQKDRVTEKFDAYQQAKARFEVDGLTDAERLERHAEKQQAFSAYKQERDIYKGIGNNV